MPKGTHEGLPRKLTHRTMNVFPCATGGEAQPLA